MKNTFLIFILLLISNSTSWAQKNEVSREMNARYGSGHPPEVPEFPGGYKAKAQFIAENLNYPPGAIREKIQGIVTIGFTIEKDGTLTEFRTLKSVYYSIDAEALRIAESMPSWIPGKHLGITIRTQHSIDILFKLPIQE